MTCILAVDLATHCGWCRGTVGSQPMFGSIRFGGTEKAHPPVFAHALTWFDEMLTATDPDVLMLEALLPPLVMQGRSQSRTFARLAGLQAIAVGLAHRSGVGQIGEVNVQTIRAHFIGERSLKRDVAKQLVFDRCQRLGWNVKNDNESDACAIWSYASALIDPQSALKVVPLFNRRLFG